MRAQLARDASQEKANRDLESTKRQLSEERRQHQALQVQLQNLLQATGGGVPSNRSRSASKRSSAVASPAAATSRGPISPSPGGVGSPSSRIGARSRSSGRAGPSSPAGPGSPSARSKRAQQEDTDYPNASGEWLTGKTAPGGSSPTAGGSVANVRISSMRSRRSKQDAGGGVDPNALLDNRIKAAQRTARSSPDRKWNLTGAGAVKTSSSVSRDGAAQGPQTSRVGSSQIRLEQGRSPSASRAGGRGNAAAAPSSPAARKSPGTARNHTPTAAARKSPNTARGGASASGAAGPGSGGKGAAAGGSGGGGGGGDLNRRTVQHAGHEEQEAQNQLLLEHHMAKLTTMKSAFQNGIAIDEQNEVDRDIARQQRASLEWIEKALCNSEPNLAGGGNSSGRISAARGQSSRAEAGNCVALGDGLSQAFVDVPSFITLQARTTDNKIVRSGGCKFSAALRGPSKTTVLCQDNSDGTYFVSYVCNVSGKYHLELRLGHQHIAGSPFDVSVASGEVEPRNCTVAGDGVRQAAAGNPASFTVTAYDRFRNQKAESRGALFSLVLLDGPEWPSPTKGTAPPKLIEYEVHDHENGIYSTYYTSTVCGDYHLHVLLGDQPVADSPYRIKLSPGDLDLTNLGFRPLAGCKMVDKRPKVKKTFRRGVSFRRQMSVGSGQSAALPDSEGDGFIVLNCSAAEQARVELAPRDMYGNLRMDALTHGGGLRATFELVEPRIGHMEVEPINIEGEIASSKNSEDGLLVLLFTPHTAGLHHMRISCDVPGEEPQQSCLIKIYAKPGPSNVFTTTVEPSMTMTMQAAMNNGIQFTIRARDGYANNRTVGGDSFNVEILSRDVALPGGGGSQFDRLVKGGHFKGGGGSSGSIISSPSTALLRAASTTAGDEVIVVDAGDGSYICSYATQIAGTYRLQCQLNNHHLDAGPITVNVDPGPTDPAMCSLVPVENPHGTNCLLGGRCCESESMQIFARDECGNRRTVGGDKFIVQLHGPSSVRGSPLGPRASFVTATVLDHDDGSYTATFEVQKVGLYDLHVLWEGRTKVGTSPFLKTQWECGEVHLPSCTCDGDGLIGTAVGLQGRFTICAFDKYSNPVPKCGPEFAVTISGPQRLKPELGDLGNGCYEVAYSTEITGVYTISVMLNGKHVRGSQFTACVMTGQFSLEAAREKLLPRMGLTDSRGGRSSVAGGHRNSPQRRPPGAQAGSQSGSVDVMLAAAPRTRESPSFPSSAKTQPGVPEGAKSARKSSQKSSSTIVTKSPVRH